MSNRILVFYGSYRSDRMGIRLAQFVVEGLRGRSHLNGHANRAMNPARIGVVPHIAGGSL